MSPLLLALALAAATAPAATLDLTPALTGPPAGAAALLEGGRLDEALAALGSASRPEARLVRGLSLEAAGRPAEALVALEGLEGALPELADRVLAARGRSLLALARPAEAAAVLAEVPSSSISWPAAALARGRALAAAGEPAAALEALGPLLAAPLGGPLAAQAAPALRLAASLRAALPTPDLAGARQALLDCWAGRPGAPEAAGCLVDLKALPGEAGRAPPTEAQVRRAEGLTDLSRNAEAVALLLPVVEASPQAGPTELAACRARAALGRALRRDRQNGRAAEVLRPVAERCTDPALRVRSRYLLATAVSAGGDREEAIALYRRFAREQPDSPLADDALFAAAELLAKAGRPGEAREALEALVRDHADGDRCDEARFRLAWLAWRAGDVDGAIAALQRIEEDRRDVDPYEHARAAYWRARLLARQGEVGSAAARAIWGELVALAPADYYALLSRAQLAGEAGVLLPEPAAAEPPRAWGLEPGPLRDDLHLRAGVALLRIGFARTAAEELRSVRLPDPRLARPAPAGAELDAVLCLATLLDRAGDHHAAHQLLRAQARAALRRPPEGSLRQVWEVAYPRAHADLVRRYAPSAGVPPELLLALMREESALDPEAVSAAGAVGLTQLMLPTAQAVARRIKVPAPDRAGLMEPDTSIHIGSAYLGELLRRFGGSPALALAAYNAGENAVGRWRAAGPGLALDEFVEEIPYDETRGYVKRVLRSYASYRLLSGSASARVGGAKVPAGG